MYDLPDDFNPAVFVGGHHEMISFGVGTIHLEFELNPNPTPGNGIHASIVSQGHITLYLPEGKSHVEVGAYASISKLGVLLNESVTKASVTGRQSIRIEFGNDVAVELDDDGDGFESYAIYLPGVMINV